MAGSFSSTPAWSSPTRILGRKVQVPIRQPAPELVEHYRPHKVDARLLRKLDHVGTIITHSSVAAVAEMIKDALGIGPAH